MKPENQESVDESLYVHFLRGKCVLKLCNGLFLGLAVLTSSACASPEQKQVLEPTPGTINSREFAMDFVDDFTRAKLRKNGEYLFCDQQGYLDCYTVSREQCVSEMSALKDDCMTRTEKKFPGRMTTAKEIDQVVAYFAVCMMIKHGVTKNTEALGSCIKNIEWDKEQRNRSLLK